MTEYKRVQGKSYMICSLEECCTGYVLSMLQNNSIYGLLPLQMERTDEGYRLWYDISGKQDLESCAKVHKMDGEFLYRFLTALQQTIQKAGEFLLQEDGILLYPDKIFLDFEEKDIYFCYMPYAEAEFTEALRAFMEYFLQHMEHDRQSDIQKCYEVYEHCQKAHVSLEDLLQLFGKEEEAEENSIVTPKEIVQEEKERKSPVKISWQKKKRIFPQIKKKEEAFVYEPEESEQEIIHPTVFLGSETKEILGELRYEGNGVQNNLKILSPVYFIGKEENEADGIIQSPTVSRIHARITKEEENYYIEDMNSTNGTYKNGKLLNYKEKVLLEKNDVIKFAEETYRFV